MSFKKNQKKYNKEVMKTGREANQYLKNSLGLINQYTTDYSGRNDFWLNKLNDRQLNLVSDKFLAQNADMLRGQAAFGSNSQLNRQIQNNAYDQNNYLADVANKNVQAANQLQNNELNALFGASQVYNTPIQQGATAAQNVDAANNAWMQPVGGLLKGVGAAVNFIPGGQAIGGAMNLAGSALGSMAGEQQVYQNKDGNIINNFSSAGHQLGSGIGKVLSTQGNQSQSSLSNIEPFNPLNPNHQNRNYGR